MFDKHFRAGISFPSNSLNRRTPIIKKMFISQHISHSWHTVPDEYVRHSSQVVMAYIVAGYTVMGYIVMAKT